MMKTRIVWAHPREQEVSVAAGFVVRGHLVYLLGQDEKGVFVRAVQPASDQLIVAWALLLVPEEQWEARVA